jgi:cobalt/nickel transport system permease protein
LAGNSLAREGRRGRRRGGSGRPHLHRAGAVGGADQERLSCTTSSWSAGAAGTFALFAALAGDPARAASLAVKSYLSAAAVLVLAGTTPLPKLVRGLESLGVPRFLTLVIQFLYRYLFVVSEQAQHMRMASLARGGGRIHLRHAAGAVATLFGRSWARAEAIHGAMLARGFDGRMEPLAQPRLGAADFALLAAGVAAPVALRLAIGVWR